MITDNDVMISQKERKLELDLNSIPFADDFILDECSVIIENNIELFNELLNDDSIKNCEIENIYL